MSTFTQGKQPNCGYGKSTGSHPRAGDRYGNQPKNRRENTFRYEDISSGPPPWLNLYLENFKKKFIVELTDNIVRTLDSSYRSSAELRKQRSNYFALKKRLAELEAERNNDKLQPENIQQPVAYKANNNKFGEEKLPDKLHSHDEANCEDESKYLNEPVPSSSKTSSPEMRNESLEKIVQLPSSSEYLENLVNDKIEVTRDVIPSDLSTHFQDDQDNKATIILNDVKDDMELSPIQTNETADNSKQCVGSEIKCSLDEIFNLLRETKLNEETLVVDQLEKVDGNSEIDKVSIGGNVQGDETSTDENIEVDKISTVEHLLVDKIDIEKAAKIDKTFDEQNQITIMKLTSENLKRVIENIQKVEINIPEKQQEVLDIIFDRAIKEPNNSSVYAQLCKQFSDIHKCTETFREMLITRCNIELMNHKENVTVLMKMKERSKCDEKENVNENEIKSHEFMGTILFIGELYNQELLTNGIIEKYIQCLLQNGTESEYEYLRHILDYVGQNFKLHDESIALYMNHLSELREFDGIDCKFTTLINSLTDLLAHNWPSLIHDDSSETTEFEDATNGQ